MKKLSIITFLLFLTFNLANSMTDCQIAVDRAIWDFNKGEYSFHSLEHLPTENAYTYVLRKYYKINWYFVDDLEYYNCYDAEMTKLLKKKYGNRFLERAEFLADSISKTPNWTREVEFPGGQNALHNFLSSRLIKENIQIDSKPTDRKISVSLMISANGKVSNFRVRSDLYESENVIKIILNVVRQMPNWKPAYQYGQPIGMGYTFPIFLKDKEFRPLTPEMLKKTHDSK